MLYTWNNVTLRVNYTKKKKLIMTNAQWKQTSFPWLSKFTKMLQSSPALKTHSMELQIKDLKKSCSEEAGSVLCSPSV